jgi:hypothetical protein
MINGLRTIKMILKITMLSILLVASNFALAEKKLSVTLEQAAEQVRKSEDGKILSAKTTYFNGQLSHRIQVLTPSGTVKIIQVPTSNINYNNFENPNNIETNKNQQDNTPQNKRPSRYQDLNQQKPRQDVTKPNYQRPTRPKTNRDKSGNKNNEVITNRR